MAKLKNGTREKFTVVDNSAVRDEKLSLKALGLLVKLLSLPDNWEFSENGLVNAFKKDGKTSIKSAIKELEINGYLIRKQCRKENGQLSHSEWTIYEVPVLDKSSSDEPITENQSSENVPNKIYTNQIKTNELKNNKKAEKIPKEHLTNQFEIFWELYPRKVSKNNALSKFIKLNPSNELFETILQALKEQKKTKQWENVQYVPHPATWIHQQRWNDEIPKEYIDQRHKVPDYGTPKRETRKSL